MLEISTVNVNGLRAAGRKGFVEWLGASGAGVVCVQETRAEVEQLPVALAAPAGWHVVLAPSSRRGYAGVGLYSRWEPEAVRVGFGAAEFAGSGRYVEGDFTVGGVGVTVGSLYLPSGQVNTPRQEEKERFMEAFLPYLAAARRRAEVAGRELVVGGDFNIAHTEADLRNWRNNRANSGFLPVERAWLSRVFDEVGLVDVVRLLYPGREGPYSWWSNRGRAFDNDVGWRIDYQVVSPGLAKRAVWARVERAATYAQRWSDHAPVTVHYDVAAVGVG